MEACVIVHTTAPDRAAAARIAEALVAERLAACVQIVPIESWYRWEGAVTQAAELLVQAKTTAARADAAIARIAALHDYALPEAIVTSVAGGSTDYLAWLRREVAEG